MRKIIVFVGSLVISLLLVTLPALCIASFILDWSNSLTFFLLVLTVIELALVLMVLFYYFWNEKYD